MTESLKTLTGLNNTALGYPPQWVENLRMKIGGDAPFATDLVLTTDHVLNLISCVGLYKAEKGREDEPISHQEGLQAKLTHTLLKRWFTALKSENEIWPFQYVALALNDYESMPPDLVNWLSTQEREARIETVGEIAAVIHRVADSFGYPEIRRDVDVVSRFTAKVDDVTLVSDDVDLVIGKGETVDGVFWPGSILVSFVPSRPTGDDLDRLAYSALIYALNHGGPPARVVVFGLLSGLGTGMEVERDWVELPVGGLLTALPVLIKELNNETQVLTPGDHCVRCPELADCPFAQMRPSEWF